MCGRKKHTFWMHDMNPLVQLIPDSRDGYITLKLLASSSRWTYALVAFSFFFWRKWGLQPIMDVTSAENKNVKETRGVSPRTQIKSIYSEEHIK